MPKRRPRNPHPPASATETRTRLLEAAGEVFAARGFRDATVREICRRARANIAGVNYHFGGKARLYSALLRSIDDEATARNPYIATGPDAETPEGRLRWFVRQFLGRVFDTGRPAWHERLMAREMIEPTRALDDLVERNIRPRSRVLRSIVGDILGPDAGDALVQRCAASIVGQCLFYWHCKPIIARLMPDLGFDPANIERLADHVARFSLGGLWAAREEHLRSATGSGANGDRGHARRVRATGGRP